MKDFEDRIDAYLRNKLSQNEKAQFEEAIQHNVELQNQFNEIYELRQGIKYGDLASASITLRELENELSKKDKLKTALKWLIILSALAAISLCVYFFFKKPIVNNSRSQTIATVYEPEEFDRYIYHHTIRTAHSPTILTDSQKKAYNLYSIQSFEVSIPKLEKLWNSKHDTLAYYYLGISYFATNNYEKADAILSSSFLKEYNKPKK